MNLSEIFIVVLGILFFFGGAAWLEIRSRRDRRARGQGGQSLPTGPPKHAGGTVDGPSAAKGK